MNRNLNRDRQLSQAHSKIAILPIVGVKEPINACLLTPLVMRSHSQSA
ncbi:MAG: hypothetical protein VKL41_02105 [Snowella sp.]|nr:hypothetical protein [Snowella sp.]